MVLLATLLNNYRNSDKVDEKSMQFKSSKQNDKNMNLKSTSIDTIKDNVAKLTIGVIIIYCFCGAIAVYFSWTHNTKIGWTTGYKVLFAIFAFFCPFEYLTIYFTYKSDLLKYMERTNTEFNTNSSVSSPVLSSNSNK